MSQSNVSQLQGDASLRPNPLLNLCQHFTSAPPNALMISANDADHERAGVFAQIVKSGSWRNLHERQGLEPSGVTDAFVFPVLWPVSGSGFTDEIWHAQRAALSMAGLSDANLVRGDDVRRRIFSALNSPPSYWGDFWEDLIASQFGVTQGGLAALNQTLAKRGARIILVLDGISEIFGGPQDIAGGSGRHAVEALLRMTNRIDELSDPHLGIITLVRSDCARAAISQNFGQMAQRFDRFCIEHHPELAQIPSPSADDPCESNTPR